jgi:uncharacterized membrane protein
MGGSTRVHNNVGAGDSSGFLTRFHRRFGPGDRAALTAAAVCIGYFLFIGWLAVRQHDTFHTRARDMGIYAQVVWNTAHGRPYASTLLAENSLHLAEHVAPVLALIAPAYAAWPDPRWLLLLQQACLAGAGWALYGFARRRLGSWLGLVPLVGYFAMPAMSRVALSEFHPIVMAALPATLGIIAAIEGRLRHAVAWLGLGLLLEEEMTPIVGAVGAFILVVRRQPVGFAIGAWAAVWLGVLLTTFMPALQERGRGLREVGRTAAHFDALFDNPGIVLDWLLVERGPEALLWLIAPGAGLALLAPTTVALALPAFTILFLQDRDGTFAGHWSGAMLPIFWLAVTMGMARLREWRPARATLVSIGCAAAVGLASGLSYWRYSLFPLGRGHDADRFEWTSHEADLAAAVELVPPGVRFNGTRRVVPHVAHRPDLFQFPSTFYTAPMRPDLSRIEVFLLDLTDSPTRRALDPTDSDTVLTRRPRLHVRAFGDNVILATRERPSAPIPLAIDYGGTVRLVGTEVERWSGHSRIWLYWEATGRVTAQHRVLRGPGFERVDVPLEPELPPNRWDRGQIVAESVDVDVELAPDTRIEVGWLAADGASLATVTLP